MEASIEILEVNENQTTTIRIQFPVRVSMPQTFRALANLLHRLPNFGRCAFPRKEVSKNSGVGGSCICGSTISPSESKGQKLFLNKLWGS